MDETYTYLFRFGDEHKPVDMLGPSIAYFWNDIYDLMEAYREMFVERLDGKIFQVSEIKQIARDLIEDMEEDSAEIWLDVEDNGKRLHFLVVGFLSGLDLDELQDLVERYFLVAEPPLSVWSTDETRILHFEDMSRTVFLVFLDDFEFGEITEEMVSDFIAKSKEYTPNELFIVSDQGLTASAEKLVKSSKISIKSSNGVLTEINELNLDLALDEFNFTVSHEPKTGNFQNNEFCILLDMVKKASSNIAKKNTLENLANYLFNTLDGFNVLRRNHRGLSEEIDLLVSNESADVVLSQLGNPIAIECRHRKTPAGSKDIRDFKGKLVDLGLKSGILLTLKGVTGDKYDSISVLREARKAGQLIIVICMDDLFLIAAGKDPIAVIKDCFYNSYR